MKRKLIILPFLALVAGSTLVSCGKSSGGDEPAPYVPCSHVDANHDGKCDKCNQGGLAVVHVDTNPKDYHCDVCGQIMEHECIDVDENEECDICGSYVPIPVKEPEEFGGYRRVYYPEDGHEYLLGLYQQTNELMIFFNGSPHRDPNGDYPYYLGCQKYTYTGQESEKEVDAGEGAVKVKVDYVTGSTELFTIQFVDGTGIEDPQYYHGYLQVYGDYNSSVKTSLKFDPSLDATYGAWRDNETKEKASCTSHKDADKDGLCDVCDILIDAPVHECVDDNKDGLCDTCNKTLVAQAPCSNKFRIIKNHIYGQESKEVYAIATDFANQCDSRYAETSEPVALGTWGSYDNVESVTSDKICDNFIAHFWEKIEQPE